MATIDNGVEYALYLLAVRHPHDFEEVKRFPCAMLANDETKANQAKAILHGVVRSHVHVARVVELLEGCTPPMYEYDAAVDEYISVPVSATDAAAAHAAIEALA